MPDGTCGSRDIRQLGPFSVPFRKTRGRAYFFPSHPVNGELRETRNLGPRGKVGNLEKGKTWGSIVPDPLEEAGCGALFGFLGQASS